MTETNPAPEMPEMVGMYRLGSNPIINRFFRNARLKSVDSLITKFEVKNSWIVRQFQNEFNPIHWHGGHISGAGFLKVPKNWGNFDQEKGDNTFQGGNLNFIDGSHVLLNIYTLF